MKAILATLLFFEIFTSTGQTVCGTGANNAGIGATAWTNPGNITANDNTTASCNAGASSQYLVASNFGFSIPAGSTINGITAIIEATEGSGGTENVNAQLQNESGTLFGSSKVVNWSGAGLTQYTYGANNDLWGATITEAIVEDPDFGVRFWYTTAHNTTVDYVSMAIEYTTPLGHRIIVVSKK